MSVYKQTRKTSEDCARPGKLLELLAVSPASIIQTNPGDVLSTSVSTVLCTCKHPLFWGNWKTEFHLYGFSFYYLLQDILWENVYQPPPENQFSPSLDPHLHSTNTVKILLSPMIMNTMEIQKLTPYMDENHSPSKTILRKVFHTEMYPW